MKNTHTIAKPVGGYCIAFTIASAHEYFVSGADPESLLLHIDGEPLPHDNMRILSSPLIEPRYASYHGEKAAVVISLFMPHDVPTLRGSKVNVTLKMCGIPRNFTCDVLDVMNDDDSHHYCIDPEIPLQHVDDAVEAIEQEGDISAHAVGDYDDEVLVDITGQLMFGEYCMGIAL